MRMRVMVVQKMGLMVDRPGLRQEPDANLIWRFMFWFVFFLCLYFFFFFFLFFFLLFFLSFLSHAPGRVRTSLCDVTDKGAVYEVPRDGRLASPSAKIGRPCRPEGES